MYEGGSSSNINAQIEADRLAAAANPDRQPDPAEERAERMTRRARLVVGIAAVAGFTWLVAGPGWAAVAAVIGVAVAAAVALLARRKDREDRPES
jgi:Flp pilus assembly protein TadB